MCVCRGQDDGNTHGNFWGSRNRYLKQQGHVGCGDGLLGTDGHRTRPPRMSTAPPGAPQQHGSQKPGSAARPASVQSRREGLGCGGRAGRGTAAKATRHGRPPRASERERTKGDAETPSERTVTDSKGDPGRQRVWRPERVRAESPAFHLPREGARGASSHNRGGDAGKKWRASSGTKSETEGSLVCAGRTPR